MRKYILSLCFAVILSCFMSVSAYAGTATVAVGSAHGNTGDTVEIPVILYGNDGFCDLSLEIGYDSSALKLVGVTENSGVTFTTSESLFDNPYTMLWMNFEDCSFNGTLATMKFEIISVTNGKYHITVDYYKGINGDYSDGEDVNFDENDVPLSLNYQNGSITVSDAPLPSAYATLSVGSAKGLTGDVVTVPVMLLTNSGFSDLSIEIDYDKTALKLISVTENMGVTFTSCENIDTVPYNMNWMSISNCSQSGVLCNLTFKIISDMAGTYPIGIDYYKGPDSNYSDGIDVNFDENDTPIDMNYLSGSIVIPNTLKLSGTFPDYTLTIDQEEIQGTVYVAVYDNNHRLLGASMHTAQETMTTTFEGVQNASFVKVMWWNNYKPVSQIITKTIR